MNYRARLDTLVTPRGSCDLADDFRCFNRNQGGYRMMHKIIPLVLCILAFTFSLATLAAPVTHPNLFLNRAEIEQVKAKIAKYPWAAAALAKTKEGAEKSNAFGGNRILDQALYAAFTGDTSFADRAREALLDLAKSE